MRYLCVHCDHRWEVEGEDAPRRCPSCMRATGIERVTATGLAASHNAATPRARGRVFAGAAFAVVCVAVAGWYFTRKPSVEGPVPLRPLSAAEVTARLAHEQTDAGALAQLLEADDAVERFAGKAKGDAKDSGSIASAVFGALRARAEKRAFVSWSLGEPRGTRVMTARETLKAIAADDAKLELYPLELSALLVAALRAEGVPAMVGELISVPNERAPLDSAGYLGYFVALVYDKEVGQGTPKVFDPYAGRVLANDAKVQMLDDLSVIASALSLRAVYEVAYQGDPKAALESSSRALRLGSRLPAVRSARGIIVLSGKMVEQGLQELEAARQLRSDAVRLNNLASASLLAGDVTRAEKNLATALKLAPDFAGAHATQASLMMLRGEMDEARVKLARAESLAPDLSLVQWAFAEYAMRGGDREEALSRAERAMKGHASFDAKLRFAVLLRQAGRYEPMRKLAHELVDGSPTYRREEMRTIIQQVLGPTALDPVEPDLNADDLEDLGGPSLNLTLGSKLLSGESARGEPAEAHSGEQNGPLILGADPSKLRLRGSGEKLKLDLDQ